MTNSTKPPESTGDAAPEDTAQELLEWRDLQNAQIDSMMHVWDNPEDEGWNNPEIPGWEVDAAEQFRPVRNSNEATGPNHRAPMDEDDHLTDAQWDLYDRMSGISEDCFCAGWIGGNEYDIWHALQHGDPGPANRRMSPRLLRRWWTRGANFLLPRKNKARCSSRF